MPHMEEPCLPGLGLLISASAPEALAHSEGHALSGSTPSAGGALPVSFPLEHGSNVPS